MNSKNVLLVFKNILDPGQKYRIIWWLSPCFYQSKTAVEWQEWMLPWAHFFIPRCLLILVCNDRFVTHDFFVLFCFGFVCMFVCLFVFSLIRNRVFLCNLGWPEICYVDQAGFELITLLLLTPEFWENPWSSKWDALRYTIFWFGKVLHWPVFLHG